MVLLRPKSKADALWAFDQALRCTGVGAVWAAWDRLDGRDFRRLQLAAESGRTLGILVRPSSRRGELTWAEVQWEVRPEQGAGGGGRGAGFRKRRTSVLACSQKAEDF
jgi:protein ImuA